jgi:hypothetical protein
MHDDIACQKVLAKDGFVQVGPARAQRQARAWYERDLTAG